ncbi:GNAT family N-acetyltransferase [Erythrobacter sp. HKB08]|uniref:GNAT family N-acetyltransferase n=1 Tax=Erythrobacter sp. HKB08 TaxID=2502843 RepID=UPI001008FFEC|nr:GNAT family N-acetyltransferase [Erythrobacter sp. HKB08]
MASRPRPDPETRIAAEALASGGLAVSALPWSEAAGSEAFRAEWQSLSHSASEPNPFHAPWALEPALKAFDNGGRCDLLCVRVDGDLVGLLPIARIGLYYRYPLPHLRNWMHDNAFLGSPLVRAGFEAPFWQALLDWVDDSAGSALFLHLTHLDENGPLVAALRDVLEAHNRPAAIVHREERAFLQSSLSSTEYFEQSLSTKKRKELRRQLRRLSDEGTVDFIREGGDGDLARWTGEFLALEAAGWKGRNGSALASDHATAQVFRETLAGAAAHGQIERLALRLDGKPIAMLANLLGPPGAFSYKTAFDEDYARFSPGVLLQQFNLEVLDRDDIAWSDSCASSDHPMIDRIWREKRSMVRISIAIGGSARQAICRRILKRETGTELEGI